MLLYCLLCLCFAGACGVHAEEPKPLNRLPPSVHVPNPGTPAFERVVLKDIRNSIKILEGELEFMEEMKKYRAAMRIVVAGEERKIQGMKMHIAALRKFEREFTKIHEQWKDNPGIITTAQWELLDNLIKDRSYAVEVTKGGLLSIMSRKWPEAPEPPSRSLARRHQSLPLPTPQNFNCVTPKGDGGGA